jgi:hypothetical protein
VYARSLAGNCARRSATFVCKVLLSWEYEVPETSRRVKHASMIVLIFIFDFFDINDLV